MVLKLMFTFGKTSEAERILIGCKSGCLSDYM